MRTPEQDTRLALLNTLLTTPHRDLAALCPLHRDLAARDPRFYVRLAAWYAAEGDVRDHKEMFVVTLALSDDPGHREVGLALLRELPPYQVGRVVGFVKGQVLRRRVKQAGGTAVVLERRGLFRNVPRSMVTEVRRYLREREADPDWFDGTVLQARQAIKRLYAGLHIAPSPRAQAILFDDRPPPDSRLFALKQIAQARTPAEQARAIVQHRIPYRVAVSVVRHMTPMVVVALLDSMTPQELISNLGSLKRRGALDAPEVKALVEAKLEQARSDKRVSAYKAQRAAAAVEVPPDLAARLEAVTDSRVQAKGAIVRSTALLIDKSGSMSQAIEIGKHLGALIAGACRAELVVYAFDTLAYPIQVPPAPAGRPGQAVSAWERAMAGIMADGATSCGVALEVMVRKKQAVEQIVLVTDEEENTAPYFVEMLLRYRLELAADPHVILVKTQGASQYLEQRLSQARIPFDAYQFAGDYYALPNLIPLLARPTRLDLLLEIMDWPLPVRKGAV